MVSSSPLQLDEIRPFIEVAQSKGLLLTFEANIPEEDFAIWRADLDLVRASIENAVVRARQQQLTLLVERLERLRDSGTAVQQVDFVLGDKTVYYFSDDVERMVAAGPQAAYPFALQPFSWWRCRPRRDGSQNCEERHSRICLIDSIAMA